MINDELKEWMSIVYESEVSDDLCKETHQYLKGKTMCIYELLSFVLQNKCVCEWFSSPLGQ